MKIYSIVCALIFSFSAMATTVGFEHGSDYTSNTYEGNVTASCASGTRIHYCSAYDLSPSMYTRLVTSQSLNADRFEITATHESGKTKSKKGKFKGTKSKAINLWLRTLLQRPLLAFGVNQITYKITKNGNTVEAGEFEVNVARGERRACRRGYLRMSGDSCNNSSSVCNEYFRRGYCRN